MAMDYETFKAKGLSFEELADIPKEERRDLLHRLIEEKDSAVSAVLFDAKRNRTINIFDLADDIGLEECTDLVNDIIDKKIGRGCTLTGDEIRGLFEKVSKGEASEEEERLIRFLSRIENHENEEAFHVHFLDMIAGFMMFSEKEIGYIPKIGDIMGCIGVFCTWAMTMSKENNGLSKYAMGNADTVSEIGVQVGEDIYNAWKATLTEELDPSFVLTGLMYLATKIAKENNYKLPDTEALFNAFGLEHECDCNGDCGDGSNTESEESSEE